MKTRKLKILIVLPRQLGDILLGLPMAKILQDCANHESLEIHWYSHPMGKLILENHPWVQKVHYYPTYKPIKQKGLLANFFLSAMALLNHILRETKFLIALRNEKFAVAVDVINNPRTAIASFFTAAPLRISFTTRWNRSWAFHEKVNRDLLDKGYIGKTRLHLLEPFFARARLGYFGDVVNLPIPKTFMDNEKFPKTRLFPTNLELEKIKEFLSAHKLSHNAFFTFAPTHRHDVRKWSPESFLQLARMIAEKYRAPIVWLWGPGEDQEVMILHKSFKNLGFESIFPPLFNLRETSYLCGLSRCFVGNSSGLSHVATAGGARTAVLHGPTSPISWEHPDTKWHLGIQRNNGCLNCGKNQCALSVRECLNHLKPEEVFQKIEVFLTNSV